MFQCAIRRACRPCPPLRDDKQFGVRFNGVLRAGQTAVDGNSDQRALRFSASTFEASACGCRPTSAISISISAASCPTSARQQRPAALGARCAQEPGTAMGQPARKDLFGVVRGELDITEHVTAYAMLGAHDFRWHGGRRQPIVVNSPTEMLVDAPQHSQYQSMLTADRLSRPGRYRPDRARVRSRPPRTTATSDRPGQRPALRDEHLQPQRHRPAQLATPAANKTATMTLSAWRFADTLSAADKRIQLTVGARLQQVKSANFNALTGAQTRPTTRARSARRGAVVQAAGRTSPSTATSSRACSRAQSRPPSPMPARSSRPSSRRSTRPASRSTGASSPRRPASSRSRQPSILTNVANNTQFLGGEQRNQGLEFNFFGELKVGVRAGRPDVPERRADEDPGR